MVKHFFIWFVCIGMIFPGISRAQQAETVPGQVLLQVKNQSDIPALSEWVNQKLPDFKARITQEISKPMHVWLVEFDAAKPAEPLMRVLNQHASVTAVQVNHVIQQRATVPNDASFAQQWQYINTGAAGGVVDADIDADLAWDYATGGLTPLGDTIVACIIDDGISMSHPDFGTNRWYNFHEIQGNNLDDDGNGYVDDFRGWDADNQNDNISGGGHGTPVAGIVGAKGNNGVGVTGVNWNVKLMVVVGGGNEAQAIAAYSYPLTMRKLWNETGGAKGAYVVVTNASWGVDYGQPSQAPLWCAMYDSLGKYGVISCGATANLNINIDTQGDLPTACPSDYLISVTNMNRQDNKVQSAGYGVTTIDLGAPGQDTYTTTTSAYGGFGGTSGATPHVTGAVALLYSMACERLAALAITHPDSAALQVKEFILQGVDPNASIQNNTVTGGRLNLHGAAQQLFSWGCTTNGCFEAYALGLSDRTDTTALLSWQAFSAADSFWVQYRAVGASQWDSVRVGVDSLWIGGLSGCQDYEFRVRVKCDSTYAGWSSVHTFFTDGCCEVPANLQQVAVGEDSIQVQFQSVLAANGYNLGISTNSFGPWQTSTSATNNFTFNGLDTCTVYFIRVQTVCDSGVTPWTNVMEVQTTGCEGCDQPYCVNTNIDASNEWIQRVTLGNIQNVSGSNNGYADFSGQFSTNLAQTGQYQIGMGPGYSFIPYLEVFSVFIDYNQDGDFLDAGELACSASSNGATTVGNFTVPLTALLGTTKMRVLMRYNVAATSCGSSFFGEVEDYCVEITDVSTNAGRISDRFTAYPNPTSGILKISDFVLGDSESALYLVNSMGEIVQTEVIHAGENSFDFSRHSPGLYNVRIENGQEHAVFKLLLLK